MKRFLLFIFVLTPNLSAWAQSDADWFERGEAAFDREDYQEAISCYKRAAELGSTVACGSLAYLYYNGAVPSVKNGTVVNRNTELAKLWAKRAGLNNSVDADIVLALTAFYEGDFSQTIKILESWNDVVMYSSEAKLALAVSYMVNGDDADQFFFRDRATQLASMVYRELYHEYSEPDIYYAACAILAKLELEKDWDINNDNIYTYLGKFGTFGKDDFELCPLSEFVAGFILTRIEDTDIKTIGLHRIQLAAEFDYNKAYKILYPFAPEIIRFYNKIK